MNDTGRSLAGMRPMIYHCHLEVSTLQLLNLLTEVLIRGDEDY